MPGPRARPPCGPNPNDPVPTIGIRAKKRRDRNPTMRYSDVQEQQWTGFDAGSWCVVFWPGQPGMSQTQPHALGLNRGGIESGL